MTATPDKTKGESSNSGDADSSSPSVLVLYRISNSPTDSSRNEYNAFQIPKQSSKDTFGKKVMTLSHIKKHLTPLFQTWNGDEGCNGYHWRVLASNATAGKVGWYDAKKESDFLPFQSLTAGELQCLLHSTSSSNTSSSPTKSASEHKMDVLVLKLLDLEKIHFDECQKKVWKKKLQQKRKLCNNSLVTTRSSGPSLLSSHTTPLDHGRSDCDNSDIVLSKVEDMTSSEEKKEEELLATTAKPSIEDHPLSFACKPSMRESILSSLPKGQELVVSSGEINRESVQSTSTPIKRIYKERHHSDDSSVSESVEVVLSKSTTTTRKEEGKHENYNRVAAKTAIVANQQNEYESVLTKSPVRYLPPAAKADKKTKSPSSPSYHRRHSNVKTHSKKTQEVNVRKTSPTASPTNYYKRYPHRNCTKAWSSSARSNSPSSVVDFADPVPAKSKQQLCLPNIDLPVFNMNESPPPLCPHQGWEDTLGFMNATTVTTPQRQEQQMTPVRKLSWEDAIQGPALATTPTIQDLLIPTTGNNYQQQQPESFIPFTPSSHCMV